MTIFCLPSIISAIRSGSIFCLLNGCKSGLVLPNMAFLAELEIKHQHGNKIFSVSLSFQILKMVYMYTCFKCVNEEILMDGFMSDFGWNTNYLISTSTVSPYLVMNRVLKTIICALAVKIRYYYVKLGVLHNRQLHFSVIGTFYCFIWTNNTSYLFRRILCIALWRSGVIAWPTSIWAILCLFRTSALRFLGRTVTKRHKMSNKITIGNILPLF